MFEVQISWLFFLYLLIFLVPVIGAWFWSGMSSAARERHAASGLIRCRLCGLVHPANISDEPTKCPRCGAFNENETARFF